ncbi:MAG: phenylalanine--tRNA ligase subunit alpha [Candidatus Tectomicrobia bacterium]|uniref:Phenylalanine--tRNA ligase alpha subunit n=1 Tax=Tectimicrobiota bacterium TaxID=2528274 RepID=A0A933GLQ0_UNCTE|nr:phenylalanine--tRNA ligase subunit alpha [Candidatus Tectomicrobia bacterium]
MKDKILILKSEAEKELALVQDEKQLQELRIKYLGRKGAIAPILKSLANVPEVERRAVGQLVNELKDYLEKNINQKGEWLRTKKLAEEEEQSWHDISLPGRTPALGFKHPISQVMEEVARIFVNMGFDIAEGPEVELDYYNFEALNIPKNHPARDMQDTFYVSHATDDVVLRTHTSPVQIRTMEKQPPPVKIIAPGKVYRRDADITHNPMFHQVEGLLVDEGVSLANLKGTLETFVHRFFSLETATRFRPSFFPFTEPSAEVDIQCVMCRGSGCRLCSSTGWLEILGSGMVDPAVYGFVNYDPEKWTGFAFGMGIERLAMLKYGIDDIRLFFENDLRFLHQFFAF